jgi:hypothetical protein
LKKISRLSSQRTHFVPLLSLIVKPVSDFVADDRADGREVEVLGHVGIEEDALELMYY